MGIHHPCDLLVCPQFNVEFDVDIFYLFIPLSLQAIAKLEQLTTMPQLIVLNHDRQLLFGLVLR